MSYRGVVLLLLTLACSGCAYLEGPRWVLLGDNSEEAFFIDRKDVHRLPNGNYRYPVKICLYEAEQPHRPDESHETNKVLFVEMDCRKQQWTEAGTGVMGQDNRIIFRHVNLAPRAQPIDPDSIHAAAYNYLCRNSDIVAQHNH